jgi:serpin B
MGSAQTSRRSPDAVQRGAKRNGAPRIRGPRLWPLDPGSAAHHFVLRCARGTLTALALLVTTAAHAAEDDARIKQLTAAYRTAGQALFAKLADEPGNIVFSPYSIGTAMAMAFAGAGGDTAAEMAEVLKLRMNRADVDAANGALIKILNGYDHSAAAPDCPAGATWNGKSCEGPAAGGRCPGAMRKEGERCTGAPTHVPASAKLAIANALMMPGQGEAIRADYRALVRDHYAAEVFTGARLEDVNGWVSKKTEGKIPKILATLDPNAVAVLLNAVYFKAHWAQTFGKSATRDQPFSLSAAQTIQVPTMRQNGHFAVTARPGYRAIALPYDVDELAMVVVVPDEVEGLAEVARRLDGEELAALYAALATEQPRAVRLDLPRFKTSFAASLRPAFEALGMHLAFDRTRADFGAMAAQGPLMISDILHRAVIDVMEEGTEAAAATAVVITARSARRPEEPEPFRVDRPFLFSIVDRATGAVLFAGRITDPREGK